MIIGLGIDIVQNERVNQSLAIHKQKLLKKILAPNELMGIDTDMISIQHIAGVFAAKEAVIKSLSNYLGFALNFHEIIVKKNIYNVPIVKIQSKKVKNKLLNINLVISISHEEHLSIAIAVAEMNRQ